MSIVKEYKNSRKTECKKCGHNFVSSKGSNCDRTGLCGHCIKKVQDSKKKFWVN